MSDADQTLPARFRRTFSSSAATQAVGPTSIVLLCLLHSLAIWTSLGGRAGLTNGWPLWRHDHPLYYHSALVTRAFLRQSSTTAGYDPSFMSGYAKSVVFPASSTLPEVVIAAFGGIHPEFAYKVYVLLSAAVVPWLIAMAGFVWRFRSATVVAGVGLALVYIWTDFPISYVAFGMLPYFLGIPLGLVAAGVFARYLTIGGFRSWIASAALMSLAVLVHLTTAMILAPAALLAYIAACWNLPRRLPGTSAGPDTPVEVPERWDLRLTRIRHAGVWLIPVVVLAFNAFWWLPGLWLSSTKGPSDFAFYHPEGVISRLARIVGGPEAPIQCLLLATGLPGLVAMIRRNRVEGVALLGFCGAGLFWGYLAGGLRAFDFLQPGRHTYALYSGLTLAAARGLEEVARRFRAGSTDVDHFSRWVMVGAALIALRMVGAPLLESVRSLGSAGEPFLSSRPSHRMLWVIERVRRHVKPGEHALRGGGERPARYTGSFPARSIQWTAPETHRSRTPGRSLFARRADDQLHAVR